MGPLTRNPPNCVHRFTRDEAERRRNERHFTLCTLLHFSFNCTGGDTVRVLETLAYVFERKSWAIFSNPRVFHKLHRHILPDVGIVWKCFLSKLNVAHLPHPPPHRQPQSPFLHRVHEYRQTHIHTHTWPLQRSCSYKVHKASHASPSCLVTGFT